MLNLAQFTGQFVDDVPATQPDAAQSIAAFTQQYGSSLERIDTSNKYLMLLSILDYLWTNDPATYQMQDAVCFQDGDGYLSAGIDEDSPDYSLSEWLQHFAWIAQESGSDRGLLSIAATLFESLRRGQ